MSVIGKVFSKITGADKAAEQAQQGAQLQADAQREALEYLKEREVLPQELREQALTQLSGFYELPTEAPQALSQEGLLTQAQASPLYDAILGTRQAGEDAILRSAAATGGLRSGNTIEDIASFGQQLEQNALLTAFNQAQQRDDIRFGREDVAQQRQIAGLTGLAQLPSYAGQIAQQTAGIGQTLGQGQIAAGQAYQAGIGQGLSTLTGGLTGLAEAGVFSDRRLKKNIKKVDEQNGFNIYTWDWAKKAERLGLTGSSRGVMADEVESVMPEAIQELMGYKTVDYSMIGVKHG